MTKTASLLVTLLICTLTNCVAQVPVTTPLAPNFPGFTFRWSGGYAWSPVSQNIPAPVINTYSPSVFALTGFGPLTNISAAGAPGQVVHNSYGNGFNLGFRFGYMFNPYVGVDLGVAYSQSTTISAYQQTIFYQPDSTGNPNNPQPSGGYLNNTITTKSFSVSLSPSVTLAYSKPKFKAYPYIRAGVTLPVFTQVSHSLTMVLDGAGATQTSYNPPYFMGDITTVNMYTNMLFNVGFNGAVGVVWRPANFINFFAELSGQYLNQTGKYTLITTWNADGNDFTPNMGAYRLETDYVKKLSTGSNNIYYNNNPNVNAPKQDVSPVFPFSNLGFNLGIQLVLSKKVFKDQDGFDQDRSKKEPKPKPKKKKKAEGIKPTVTS